MNINDDNFTDSAKNVSKYSNRFPIVLNAVSVSIQQQYAIWCQQSAHLGANYAQVIDYNAMITVRAIPFRLLCFCDQYFIHIQIWNI